MRGKSAGFLLALLMTLPAWGSAMPTGSELTRSAPFEAMAAFDKSLERERGWYPALVAQFDALDAARALSAQLDSRPNPVTVLGGIQKAPAPGLDGVLLPFLAELGQGLSEAEWAALEGMHAADREQLAATIVAFRAYEHAARIERADAASRHCSLDAPEQSIAACRTLDRVASQRAAAQLLAVSQLWYVPRVAAGPVIVGPALALDLSGMDSTYDLPSALIIDVGGNDTYRNAAGGSAASPLRTGALMDLAGNDTYGAGWISGSNGGADGGNGFLFDAEGNDVYLGGSSGSNGGASVGFGVLVDLGGNDTYTAGSRGVNGGAYVGGIGLLFDAQGDDNYRAEEFGVNGGAYIGAGRLVDVAGRDSYFGQSWGANGGATGGGIGFLWEGEGDDVYRATGGYWVSYGTNGGAAGYGPSAAGLGSAPAGALGFLRDARGNDIYESMGYGGNGAGEYSGVGSLLDLEGNDRYTARWTAGNGGGRIEGAGHLLDLAGDDVYSGGAASNGGAETGSGLLIDAAGDDTYFSEANGLANLPGHGMLLDGGGNDQYYGHAAGTDVSVVPAGSGGAQIDLPWRPKEASYFDELLTPPCGVPALGVCFGAAWRSGGNSQAIAVSSLGSQLLFLTATAPPDESWPILRVESRSAETGAVSWIRHLGATSDASGARLGVDETIGVVYVAYPAPPPPDQWESSGIALVALDPITGETHWSQLMDSDPWEYSGASALVALPDGVLLVEGGKYLSSTRHPRAWAFAHDGSLRWSMQGERPGAWTAAVVTPEGVVLVGTERYTAGSYSDFEYVFQLVDANGLSVWRTTFGGPAPYVYYNFDRALSVVLDASSGIIAITGEGAGPTNTYGRDVWTIGVASATGVIIWRARFDGPDAGFSPHDRGVAMAINPRHDAVHVLVQSEHDFTTPSEPWVTVVTYDLRSGDRRWTERTRDVDGDTFAGDLLVNADGTELTVLTSGSGVDASDVFVDRLDAMTGLPIWSLRFDETDGAPQSALRVFGASTGIRVTGNEGGAGVFAFRVDDSRVSAVREVLGR